MPEPERHTPVSAPRPVQAGLGVEDIRHIPVQKRELRFTRNRAGAILTAAGVLLAATAAFLQLTGYDTITPPTRQVTIHRLDLLEFDPENRTCVIDVACSKGTYIRTLCHDIGEALGCGGMLTALRRTETLGFTTADCHTLEELKQASEEGRFEELLMPVDTAFRQYKSIFLSPKQTKMFLDGIRLDTNRIKIPAAGDTVRVYGENRFLALAHIERSIAELQIIKLFYTKENPNC